MRRSVDNERFSVNADLRASFMLDSISRYQKPDVQNYEANREA